MNGGEKVANRTRKFVLRVPVTPEERALIQQKMAQLGTKNFSAYARKMLIDGYMPQRYYCFYRHTAQLRPGGGAAITANMTYDNPSLTLQFPSTQTRILDAWGIVVQENTPTGTIEWIQKYHIDHLSSERLVMTTEQGVEITCRKF